MIYVFDKPTLFKSKQHFKTRPSLNESIETIDELKPTLNKRMIDVLNQSSSGDKWTISSNWDEARKYSDHPNRTEALIKIYLQIACPFWGCNIQNLEPGINIIVKIFDELGFKENNNPYIGFIKVFYKINNNVTLSEGDWVNLNDWYADGIINAADLRGTGLNGKNHLIFNKNLYIDPNINADNNAYMNYYNKFNQKNFVMSLNLYAIATNKKLPYSNLKGFTKDGNRGTGVYQGGDYREVRNIIFYNNPSRPLGGLHSLNDVESAYIVGKETHSSAEATEIATGSTKADLRRDINELIKSVNSILKELNKKASDYIKNFIAKNPRATKSAQNMTDKVNQCLKDDVAKINEYVDELETIKNQTEYEEVHKRVLDFINNKMKTKKYLKDISTLKSGDIGNRVKKQQSLTYDDIEHSFDNLSKEDLDSLVRLLKSKGIVK